MLKKPVQLFDSLVAQQSGNNRHRELWASLFPVADAHASKNATIWFMGNSVSRIHFFAALAMLSGEGEQKSLSDQIQMCGRGGEWKGRRPGQGVSCLGPCACSATLPGGGRLAFVWQQRTFDKVIGPALRGEIGLDGNTIKAFDIVFVNVGLDNVVDTAKKSYTKKNVAIRMGQLTGENLTRHAASVKQLWNESVQADSVRLAEALSLAQQAGRRVVWRTSSPVCFQPEYVTNWGMATRTVNAMVAFSDAVVTAAVVARAVPVFDLLRFDHELLCGGIASGGRDDGHGGGAGHGRGDHGHDSGGHDSGGQGNALSAADRDPDESSAAAVTACRCLGYGMDSTRLHPAPATATWQVERMLRAEALRLSQRSPAPTPALGVARGHMARRTGLRERKYSH